MTALKFYLVTLVLLVPAANAQRDASIQANIRGGGGGIGRCTFEVVVDDVAEVEIRGDRGSIRTIAGAPANWMRLDCTQALPPNPRGFRFRGLNGRGSQRLVSDPRFDRGAVVRVQDPQGGSGRYVGELSWDGQQGGNWGPGPGAGVAPPPPGPNRPPGPGGNWGGGGWTGTNGGTFEFYGDGRGFLNRRDGRDLRVRDVRVSLDRSGFVNLAFQSEGFDRRLTFNGRATRYGWESIDAIFEDGPRSRSRATIYVDRRGNVQRITMDGRMRGDEFTLDWRSR
jgi:hypothetical protein